jgi:hypothetical protein
MIHKIKLRNEKVYGINKYIKINSYGHCKMFLSIIGFLGYLWVRPHAHSRLLLHQTIERGNLLSPSLPSRIEVKGL